MRTLRRHLARTWTLIHTRVARHGPTASSPAPRDPDLREALAAAGFARAADTRAWLLHIARFCEEHGGEAHYTELLDLTRRALAEVDACD